MGVLSELLGCNVVLGFTSSGISVLYVNGLSFLQDGFPRYNLVLPHRKDLRKASGKPLTQSYYMYSDTKQTSQRCNHYCKAPSYIGRNIFHCLESSVWFKLDLLAHNVCPVSYLLTYLNRQFKLFFPTLFYIYIVV